MLIFKFEYKYGNILQLIIGKGNGKYFFNQMVANTISA